VTYCLVFVAKASIISFIIQSWFRHIIELWTLWYKPQPYLTASCRQPGWSYSFHWLAN